PALQSLGLLLEFLCPLPELLLDLRSDGDPQQLAASLGFRPHIVRAKHGGFRLSPPCENKARGIATPINIEQLPAAQRRYSQGCGEATKRACRRRGCADPAGRL